MSSRFHNKWHRHNHHTNPTVGEPDSSHDPIASPDDPFQGDFVVNGTVSSHNVITTNFNVINTASSIESDTILVGDLTANNIYTTFLSAVSSIFEGDLQVGGCVLTDCISSYTPTATAINVWNNLDLHGHSIINGNGYNTVSSHNVITTFLSSDTILVGDLTANNIYTTFLSADSIQVPSYHNDNWDSTYTTVAANSANWDSTYTTVSTNSANWNGTNRPASLNSVSTIYISATDPYLLSLVADEDVIISFSNDWPIDEIGRVTVELSANGYTIGVDEDKIQGWGDIVVEDPGITSLFFRKSWNEDIWNVRQ